MQSFPIHTDLVLVGGGHTHAIVLRKIGMQGLPDGVRVTLITNLADTPYSGMLPCHISGLYGFDESHIDLRPLTRFAHCRLLMAEMVDLDPQRQQVICRDRAPVAYDVLSIDIGSTPATVTVPGAAEHAIAAKPVPNLLQEWASYLQILASRESGKPATIGIVGGGVGGVELALNMQVRLLKALPDPQQVVIHVFHRGAQLATGRNRWTQRRLAKIFRDRQIQVHLQEDVIAVDAVPEDAARKQVRCASGLTVNCDRIFWVTNASAPDWIRDTDLSTDDHGFILVEDTLQTCSHLNIFAAGDIATMKHHPRPKAGVFAVRQGPPLYDNLKRFLAGEAPNPFVPQSKFLNIIDTGTGTAIASRGPFAGESRLFRRWKDWIDGNFMGLFEDFPVMERGPVDKGKPHLAVWDILSTAVGGQRGGGSNAQNRKSKIENPKPKMYCAGCASKVSSTVLKTALSRIQTDFSEVADWPEVDNIYAGLAAPDDAAVVRVPAGKLLVQTVDQFRALVDDPYVFGQICVNHCLSDLFAMGATPQSVLAIATLPYGTDDKQAELLYQLLSGAYRSLMQSKTLLVGGHTTEGPDLSLGFTCQGWVDPDQLLRKSGMVPGQALILTKPLGTGTLFAADMQLAAKGRWIGSAVASMVQSNQAAVTVLRRCGVTACTDVTGFGLAGHLLEMTTASKVAVALDLAELPVLTGALTTLEQGFESSLQSRNQQIESQILNAIAVPHGPMYQLLFDPQTAGGLLASVPQAQVSDCLEQLKIAGYEQSRCIGQVVEAESGRASLTISKW